MKKLTYKLSILLGVVLLMSSCDRDLTIPFSGTTTAPSLMIKVSDGSGNAVSGATVDLYNSLDGYITETGALSSGTTDGAGTIVFDAATLAEPGVFYFNVASGTLRNWTSTSSTAFILLNDGQTVVSTTLGEVPQAFIDLLANNWVLTDYAGYGAGVNALPACEQDDILTFLKDGSALRADGASACSGGPSIYQAPLAPATWSPWTVSEDMGAVTLTIRDFDPFYDAGGCNNTSMDLGSCPDADLTFGTGTITIDYGGGYIATLTAN